MTSPASRTFPKTAPPTATAGPFRLGSWTAEPTSPDHADADLYRATIAERGRIHRLDAVATGPIAALTDMLYQLGVGISIRELRQTGDDRRGVRTSALCEHDDRILWCSGSGQSASESAMATLLDAANQFSRVARVAL